ncbi:type II toxin-antitoxin system RelE family toxin [Winogradskya humida]|uniref:mRNA-degrading endonuclease RelE of RelBE toxin-antitoxin system n=1 Tax=Winogradskya humida TaxID=113566 RepID=A0ABQ4A276_9ACTN|nr:type II toxin-antitoxin system RelE/ParE family toxin [Actinoplanes humidus]GIE24948.1 hypothetical protein Ahu01nite_080500 [Actinoplanes humidus]
MAWRRPKHTPPPYRLTFRKTAAKQLAAGLEQLVALSALTYIKTELADDPYGQGRQLKPYPRLFSARKRQFRVIYEIDDAERLVTVIAVDDRES